MSYLTQKTIKNNVSFSGIALHSGLKVNMCIKPGEVNSGIIFKRVDLKDNNLVFPNFMNVTSTSLNTTIENEFGLKISTIEHLMCALFGLGIDNVIVEIDNEEVPILDGSATEFVEGIRSVGLKEQKELRKYIKVKKKVEIQEGKKFISIEPLDKDLIVDFEIVYENPLIRRRRKEFKLSEGDLSNIYNSRTFCLYEDIDTIKSHGLAKG